MTDPDLAALTAALDSLPKRFPGPGGVAGVVWNGQTIARRAWGYTDLDAGTPMTAATRLPLCSITKQFTCQVLLALFPDPDALNDRVARYLPAFTGPLPTIRQLAHNQSGLRDYWALTVLHGARAEQPFRRGDALPLLARMKTGHFPPGSQYSYCNANFRILSEIIEAETGEAMADLYQRLVFAPAGMQSATLTADTSRPADGVTGYEGTDATGHFTAENAIYWVGDAGLSASLDDMLAYEAWIDTTRDDPESLYNRAAQRPRFADGAPASYGFGLAHRSIAGRAFTGHGGALRGFRAHRITCRDERLSVVVLFNHEASAQAAADALAQAALGHRPPAPAPVAADMDGQYLCPQGLRATLTSGRTSATLAYATGPDTLHASGDTLASPTVSVTRLGDSLTMQRTADNLTTPLAPLPVLDRADPAPLVGHWHAPELDATLEIMARDGAAYARFTGLLGTGRIERMAPAGPDVWTIATRRTMDAPAPGDWTLILARDATGTPTHLTLGCWLARGIIYERA